MRFTDIVLRRSVGENNEPIFNITILKQRPAIGRNIVSDLVSNLWVFVKCTNLKIIIIIIIAKGEVASDEL